MPPYIPPRCHGAIPRPLHHQHPLYRRHLPSRQRLIHLGLLTSQLVVRSLQRYQGFRLGLAARGFAGSLRVESLATYRRCRRYEWEVLVGVVALLTGELYLRWVGV